MNNILQTPVHVKNFLSRLDNVQPLGSGWTARCPAHADEKNSLSISQGANGRILVKCFAGCTVKDIVQALGLTLGDLFPHDAAPRVPITLEELAKDKDLPTKFLRSLGVVDIPGRGVKITYRLHDGSPAPRQRLRTALKAGDGSRWLKGEGSPVAYGLWLLDKMRKKSDTIFLVEGESDTWTLWHHGVPALGIPGADMVKVLDPADIAGFERIYAWQEPDKGGETFTRKLAERFAEAGWTKPVFVISPPEGVKDANDLHRADPDAFKTRLEELMKNAEPLDLKATPSEDAAIDSVPAWPDPPDEAALYGLAGDIVRFVEPHSEADPIALLMQFLIAFGNAAGRSAYYLVEGDRHYLNLFAVLVGPTAKARKGTSWGRVRSIFASTDETWTKNCIDTGLSSGEGLIWRVRDPIIEKHPVRDKKAHTVTGYEEVIADEGVDDKRLLIVEPEFASTLKVLGREGNTLSPVVRQAWDTGFLTTMVKNNRARATDAHISIIAHITKSEVLRFLDATEQANGFGNRFLWVCVRRSKYLPEGGGQTGDATPLVKRLQEALEFAKQPRRLTWDEEARTEWRSIYPDLSEGRPGLLGAMTARAEAQVVRLACVYALLDCSPVIGLRHLKAALAVWDFCERSARFIFGASLGDPVADEILRALRNSPDGMSRTAIRDLFGRNREASQIHRALTALVENGLACSRREDTGGKPKEIWYTTTTKTTKTTKVNFGLSSRDDVTAVMPEAVRPKSLLKSDAELHDPLVVKDEVTKTSRKFSNEAISDPSVVNVVNVVTQCNQNENGWEEF